MIHRPEEGAEDQRRHEAARLLLVRVALGLLNDARHSRGFGGDEDGLRRRAAELTGRFAAEAGAEATQAPAQLTLQPGGLIDLAVSFEDGRRQISTVLREDGVVLGGGTGGSWRIREPDPEEVAAEEREERRQERAAEVRRGRPDLRGEHYLRTVAAPPQPGADTQVLAAQIFEDGFRVHFTYDTEMPTGEELGRRTRLDPRPSIEVADDLGTDYYDAGLAGHGGRPVSRPAFPFAPAPPPAARVLRVTTRSGTVELSLVGD